MKRISFFGIVAFSLILTACGKNGELSFEEARDISLNSATYFTDLLFASEGAREQNLALATSFSSDDASYFDVDVSLFSQQDLAAETSKYLIDFVLGGSLDAVDVQTSGLVELLLDPETVYLNVAQLGVDSSDPSMAMLSMMLWGIQGKWLSFPFSGQVGTLSGVNDYLSSLSEFNIQQKDLYIPLAYAPYEGKFAQFHGYPAHKFAFDQLALQETVNLVIEEISRIEQETLLSLEDATLSGEELTSSLVSGDIQIPEIEGYFVVLDSDTVVLVMDEFSVFVKDVEVNSSYRYGGGEGFFMEVFDSENDSTVLTLTFQPSKRKGYELSLVLENTLSLQGTVDFSPKKSAFSLSFDLVLELMAVDELGQENFSFPLKGSWEYKTIKSFSFEKPTDVLDVSEMMAGLAGVGDFGYEDELSADYGDLDLSYEELE